MQKNIIAGRLNCYGRDSRSESVESVHFFLLYKSTEASDATLCRDGCARWTPGARICELEGKVREVLIVCRRDDMPSLCGNNSDNYPNM